MLYTIDIQNMATFKSKAIFSSIKHLEPVAGLGVGAIGGCFMKLGIGRIGSCLVGLGVASPWGDRGVGGIRGQFEAIGGWQVNLALRLT